MSLPETATWLIVGLGNPGKKYQRSRHNVGFLALERWATHRHLEFSSKRPWALMGEGHLEDGGSIVRVLVALPRSYMNLSGEAVATVVQRHHVLPTRTLIVHDDMDLPLGKVRLRERGSSGGHNGVASIITSLGTDEFPRLRLGIGRPQETADYQAIGHVLGEFSGEEQSALDEVLDRAVCAIDTVLVGGMAAAMTAFNS